MKNQDLSTVFPEINDPEWIKEREECWALALEKGDWKSEYRKKDLEKIRQYFFCGKYPEGLDITKYSGVMLDLFPIQTKAGYDYYYKTHEFTPEQLESNFQSAFLDQQTSGMRWQEQREYFDYHVGHSFSETKSFLVKEGDLEISINPLKQFLSMSAKLNRFLRREGGVIYPEKLAYFITYYLSLFQYLVEGAMKDNVLQDDVVSMLMKRVLTGEVRDFTPEEKSSAEKIVTELKKIFSQVS